MPSECIRAADISTSTYYKWTILVAGKYVSPFTIWYRARYLETYDDENLQYTQRRFPIDTTFFFAENFSIRVPPLRWAPWLYYEHQGRNNSWIFVEMSCVTHRLCFHDSIIVGLAQWQISADRIVLFVNLKTKTIWHLMYCNFCILV